MIENTNNNAYSTCENNMCCCNNFCNQNNLFEHAISTLSKNNNNSNKNNNNNNSNKNNNNNKKDNNKKDNNKKDNNKKDNCNKNKQTDKYKKNIDDNEDDDDDDSDYTESEDDDDDDDIDYKNYCNSMQENDDWYEDNEEKNNNIPSLFIISPNIFNKRKRNDNGENGNKNTLKKNTSNKKQKFCNNINCDHKKHNDKWFEENKIQLTEITSLHDLVTLANGYHCNMRKEYNGVNLERLHNAKDAINELIGMIGLDDIKNNILDNIIYFLNKDGKKNSDMLHFVITGEPGCGKTTFINILGKIYAKIGILKKGHVVYAKRADLVGQYLGSTAIKTKNVVMSAVGGILIIDEAYSLGNTEGRDSFSKECIDTLNQLLSEQCNDLICGVAGYKNDLDNSFFSINQGLKRRFPFQYDIGSYSDSELSKIMFKKMKECKEWENFKFNITVENIEEILKKNKKYIVNQGGDMETAFLNLKIIHNRRIFLLPKEEKNIVDHNDIKKAFDKLIENRKKDNELTPSQLAMYI